MLGPTAALVAVLVTAVPAAVQEAAQQPAAQKAEPRPSSREPQSTQTVDVTRGMRLSLENFAGEVEVHAWDKSSVRVDARHPRGTTVQIDRKTDTLEIKASRQREGFGSIDYEISVPSWMPLRLTGTFLFVSVEGVQADIQIETVQGDVDVRGGSGSISLKSIEGDVTLDSAKGRMELSSAEGDVTVTDCAGEVTAETLEGTIRMTRVSATIVEASTIDGDIVYDGTVAGQGQYRFTTHDGNVWLRIPETTGASVSIRTYDGRFESSFPVQPPGDFKRGRRVTFTLGKGGSEIDIEAFDGQIRLLKTGEPLPEGKKKDKTSKGDWR